MSVDILFDIHCLFLLVLATQNRKDSDLRTVMSLICWQLQWAAVQTAKGNVAAEAGLGSEV